MPWATPMSRSQVHAVANIVNAIQQAITSLAILEDLTCQVTVDVISR